MQGNKDLMNGTATIKVEPGTSTQRLPSLKGRRDLSLSSFTSKPNASNQDKSKNKKIYLPNVHVKRNKPRENCFIEQEQKKTEVKVFTPERGRGRGKRGNRVVIQSDSAPFSSGFAQSLKSTRYSRVNDDISEKPTLQKPKLMKQENIKIDKKEKDLMLKELLRDDFIDDPNLEPDYENCPVKLPLNEGNIFSKNNLKNNLKTEPDIDDVDSPSTSCSLKGEIVKIKTEPGLEHNFGGEVIKIKTEPGLEDNTRGDVIKIKTERGFEDSIKGKLAEIKLDKKCSVDDTNLHLPTVKEIMSCKEPQFVMLQLPTCMPGLKPEADSNVRQVAASSSQNNGAGTSGASSSAEQSSSKPESELRCTLQSLKPGKIGKMQILKSGRVRLILGETKLWLEMGTQVSFKQDLISVDLDRNTKRGSTICMGSVPVRMTVTPDWEQMVSSPTVF